jgi:hypothetical protein
MLSACWELVQTVHEEPEEEEPIAPLAMPPHLRAQDQAE